VQREIELRAYRFWQAHGSAAGGTLDHWVRAENVVLEEFVGGRLAANETRPQTGKRSFPTAIPLHRPRPPSRPAVILPH